MLYSLLGGDRGRHQLLPENTPEECSTTEGARGGDGVLYSGEIFSLLRFEKIFIIKDFCVKDFQIFLITNLKNFH